MGWNEWSQTELLLFLLGLVFMAFPLTAVQQITNPRIVEHPEDKYVGRNDAVTLNCKAEGDPPPIITWYRNGDPVITTIENPLSHRMLLPSGQLFFLRVVHSKNSRSDVGSYYCNATNPLTGVSSISQNASLHIAMIRDEFREQPHSANRVVGDDVSLSCRPPRGDPEPKVQWKKDGAPVQSGHRIHVQEDGTLLIRSSEKTDAGLYSCVAQNIGGQRESKPARLNILEKPKIIDAPMDEVVSEHSEITFRCRANGVPEPLITWKKQKGTIPDQRSKLIDGGQSLKIRRVKVQDEGIYVCRVENSVGWQEAEARLSVLVQPSFVTTPISKSVVLGRRVSFECIASGNPVPVVFWKKEDSQTLMFPENSYGRFSVGEFGTLVIDQVQRQDAGAFVCQAQSVAGGAAAKAALTVKDTDSRPPPIIRHGLQNQTLPTKSTATLQCLTGGDPVPTVRWYRNGRVLDVSDQRITVLESGTLQINELHLADTGWYTCKAMSETGESSWSGALVIEPPTDTSVIFRRTPEPSTYPGAPSRPLVIDTKETSVKLSWKPNPNNGASQVSSYMVEHFSHETGEGWIVASDSVPAPPYVVQRLQPNTSYRFLVRAQNSHGISLPSQVTGIIRTRGESLLSLDNSSPVDPDPDLVASKLSTPIVFLSQPDVVTATTVHLRWEVRRNHRYVEGFHVKYCVVEGGGGGGGGGDGGPDHRGHDLPPANCAIQTVQNVDARKHVLKDLEEDTQYMIYIQPYYQLKEGAASSTVQVHTLEDVPSVPPSGIQAALSDNETLYLSWQPPARRHQNGVLTGYKIYVSSNDSQFSRDVFVNSSVFEMAIHDLPKYTVFSVQIAAATKLGEGVRSEEIIVGRSELEPGDQGIESKPWFLVAVIICACSFVWVLVCVVVVVCVCRRRGRRHAKYVEGQKKQVDLVTGHDRDSKEDGLSNGKEDLYENISSLCANSTTKSTFDGSPSLNCPTTTAAESRGMTLNGELHMGRRLIPPDLEPFCQAYIIKPKPPIGAVADNNREPRPMNCESLRITANNGYSPFVQSSSSLYPSLRRPIRSNLPSSTEEIFRHRTNNPPSHHVCPESTLAQYSSNYVTQQRSSLYFAGGSDRDRRLPGYVPSSSSSSSSSEGCGRMAVPCRQPGPSAAAAACRNPGYRNECLPNSAAAAAAAAAAVSDDQEPYPSSGVGNLYARSNGVQRYFSEEGEGMLTDNVHSFYHNPPSPAPAENGTMLDAAAAATKSLLMQNGHASTEGHEE